ncbi:MAG TPA: hypothetical protein VG708_05305, partial [Mycobacteriales bacterium]|nr:hypothetical protein [Mycobacteriales bacterium]
MSPPKCAAIRRRGCHNGCTFDGGSVNSAPGLGHLPKHRSAAQVKRIPLVFERARARYAKSPGAVSVARLGLLVPLVLPFGRKTTSVSIMPSVDARTDEYQCSRKLPSCDDCEAAGPGNDPIHCDDQYLDRGNGYQAGPSTAIPMTSGLTFASRSTPPAGSGGMMAGGLTIASAHDALR